MQRNMNKTPEFFCVATAFLVSNTLNAAGIAPINITLSSGAGSNRILIAEGQTAIVEYKIQDVIGRPPSRTWLWSAPLPPYMARTQSLHQPDCSLYYQPSWNPDSLLLPPNGFCYFALQVDGTAFANAYQGITATYEPLLSNSGATAYGPCEAEILSISALPPLPPPPRLSTLISVGSYVAGDLIQRPIILASQDSGTSWSYPDSATLPELTTPFAGYGILFSASCSGSTCIAAGKGEDTVFHNYPLIAVSQDSGKSWVYPASVTTPTFANFPSSGEYALLQGSSCSGNTCIAAGLYYDLTSNSRPLLALSQDLAHTWSYIESVTMPALTTPPGIVFSSGNFTAASCTGSTCLAAGTYGDTNGVNHPLLAISQDSGSTWSFPASITNPSNTQFINYGNFISATCDGGNCVAVGTYLDGSSQPFPLLATSQDSGSTWAYSYILPVKDGYFTSVSCDGNTCIAVGTTYDVSLNMLPLLALSQDSGRTWVYPPSFTTPSFPAPLNFQSGSFITASCSGPLCIATGSYSDSTATQRPLLALSRDGGSTWSYPESIITPVFSPSNTNPFVGQGGFSTASCNGSTCIASGSYSSGGLARPIVALSQDSGITWTYPDSINAPVFTPANIKPYSDTGIFGGSTAVYTPFLPDSLRRLALGDGNNS